ncbi:hypothetical protein F2Q70_00027955 [Brassica cretica]|uniref:Uncharacterized protein n=1 Tax=Brassica cretica TaxID=69181 RepID=A0A8S9L9W7_BRACR|nr:hypothetical protein F2Q70_00027955 [Brassica cretica]
MVTSWDASKNGLGFVGFGLGFQSKSVRTVSGREGASVVRSTNGLHWMIPLGKSFDLIS